MELSPWARDTVLSWKLRLEINTDLIVLLIRQGARFDSSMIWFGYSRLPKLLFAAKLQIDERNYQYLVDRPPYAEIFSESNIGQVAFDAIKYCAAKVCMALQELNLDANRLIKIVFYDCLPFTYNVPKKCCGTW